MCSLISFLILVYFCLWWINWLKVEVCICNREGISLTKRLLTMLSDKDEVDKPVKYCKLICRAPTFN